MPLCKGDSETGSDLLYFNYTNPAAGRGHVLQGMADLFFLSRFADGTIEIAADESPTGEAIRIDPERIYLVAHSQGTHYGLVVLPFEARFKAMAASGAGAGMLLGMLEKGMANTYSVRSKGKTKLITQQPWYREGEFAGIVEISFVLPDPLPHHDRDAERANREGIAKAG